MVVSKEQRLSEFYNKHPKIKITNYLGYSNNKNEFKCLVCGHVWQGRVYDYVSSSRKKLDGSYRGCPNCQLSIFINNTKKRNRDKSLTADQVKNLIYEKYKDNYELLGKYTNMHTSTEFRCTRCGTTFTTSASDLLAKTIYRKCPKCLGKGSGPLGEYSLEELQEKAKIINKYLIIYDRDRVPHEWRCFIKCSVCGFKFKKRWSNISSQRNSFECPICSCHYSRGERYINLLLQKNHIEYTREYSKIIDGNLQRFDFYIPQYSIFIEFDGEQHYNDKINWHNKRLVRNDTVKNNYAKSIGFNMVRITDIQLIYTTLKEILPIKSDIDILKLNSNIYKKSEDIARYAKTHTTKECMYKFKISRRDLQKVIKYKGYTGISDIKRLDQGVDYNEVFNYLKYHSVNETLHNFSIVSYHINKNIFHNNKYPFSNIHELRDYVLSQELLPYLNCSHTKEQAKKHFRVGDSRIDKFTKSPWFSHKSK